LLVTVPVMDAARAAVERARRSAVVSAAERREVTA